MSLFAAVQQSANALRISELGLQVTGNNIANANTPGYVRQDMVQATGVGVRIGEAIVGYGARVVGVVQKIDDYVVQRMRDANSKLAYNEQLSQANSQLETSIGELGDNDISSLMSRFANAFHDLANQPGNTSLKTLVIERGKELAMGLKTVAQTAVDIQQRSISDIRAVGTEINRLTERIAVLNTRIVEMEGGGASNSDAVGLRDERLKLLDELSALVDFRATEQESGAVTVSVGGDYLVADGIPRKVTAHLNSEEGKVEIRLADTDAPLEVSGGKLKGLYEARDGVAGHFLNQMDTLASDIIQVVNKVHSQGQGSIGFKDVLGDFAVENEFAALEQSGLEAPVDNGSFVVTVADARTGLKNTYDIQIRQQGLGTDTTTVDLIQQLDNIPGIRASLTNEGKVRITSDSEAIEFSFSKDTSGVLSALGINTFFKGNSASTMEVRPELGTQPNLLALSLDGVGKGAGNALKLASAFEDVQEMLGGRSLRQNYEAAIVDVTQNVSTQEGITEGIRNYYQTLEAQHLGTSGVSLDEEAVKMLQYQRAFQATSKLIATANDMLETLVTML